MGQAGLRCLDRAWSHLGERHRGRGEDANILGTRLGGTTRHGAGEAIELGQILAVDADHDIGHRTGQISLKRIWMGCVNDGSLPGSRPSGASICRISASRERSRPAKPSAA